MRGGDGQTVSIGLGMQSAADWADDAGLAGEHADHHHEHEHGLEHDLAAEVSQMREVPHPTAMKKLRIVILAEVWRGATETVP